MKRDRAVVIGAGFAGLTAARVLSEHFRSVIVIDKDERVGSLLPRLGVAQGAHLHVLLKRGQTLLKTFFPEIEQSFFVKAQCPKIDWAGDTQWESKTGNFPRYASDMQTYSFSRPFLEGTVHSLVSQRKNISFIRSHVEKMKVENGLATGVYDENLDEYSADLIVLAGGQHFPINRFTGYRVDEPAQHIPIQITYRSVVFEASSLSFEGVKQYYYQLAPPHESIGAVICPIENNQAVATIVEYGPPISIKTDFAGFMQMASQVPGGEFFKILKEGKPLTQVSVFHKPSMYMRRPDKISEFPENVFCVGDSFCSLNPVFGQGMTSALIQVQLMAELLADSNVSARYFHRKSAARLRLPFLLSKMGSNTRPDFFYRYLRSYLARCQQSSGMHRKFLGALHLERSFDSLVDLKSLYSAVFGGSIGKSERELK
jgi:flavin-dependent dehydrogenase